MSTSGNVAAPDWSTLPAPVDDGAVDHLKGVRLPAVPLQATDGAVVDLSTLAGLSVVYLYPRTGRPDQDLPPGWNDIPGARGCTPQSCAFRDHFADLTALGVSHVFGLSTQDLDYQREMVARLHLPFPVLSDAALAFTQALRLPTFEAAGGTLVKRMTFIIRDGMIEHVFYPVFPPDRNATDVMAWLQASR
jgi:peroxiredoxin